MNVLFVGKSGGTAGHRQGALERLGHRVTAIDDESFLPRSPALRKIAYEAGCLPVAGVVRRGMLDALSGASFDAVWVDNGRGVGPGLVREMRRRWGPVINYNHDDPYGRRDRYAWLLYQRAVRENDLTVVVREPNVTEARALGARRVERIYRMADEVAHAPRTIPEDARARFAAKVGFTGTCFEDRGAVMDDLIKRGVPLSLRGDHWNKAPEWPCLQHHWKGPGTTNDDDYAAAILSTEVNLGLLSRLNRDEHTTRSAEVPYMGALLCAPRTPEHLAMYEDGVEAVFWSDAAECADVCKRLLAEPARIAEIAARGRARALQNGNMNEPVLGRLLEMVKG